MALGTKVDPWEFVVTKINILSFVMPNIKHSYLFIDFIWTLRGGPVDESVLLCTLKTSPTHTYHMTKPSIL